MKFEHWWCEKPTWRSYFPSIIGIWNFFLIIFPTDFTAVSKPTNFLKGNNQSCLQDLPESQLISPPTPHPPTPTWDLSESGKHKPHQTEVLWKLQEKIVLPCFDNENKDYKMYKLQEVIDEKNSKGAHCLTGKE